MLPEFRISCEQAWIRGVRSLKGVWGDLEATGDLDREAIDQAWAHVDDCNEELCTRLNSLSVRAAYAHVAYVTSGSGGVVQRFVNDVASFEREIEIRIQSKT